MNESLSKNNSRNKQYIAFLETCKKKDNITVKNIAHFGGKLMKNAKVHPHFFTNHTLLNNALYLTFFSLKLPYEFRNSSYLNRKISAQEALEIFTLFERRIAERIPVEYITQEAYYLENKFFVNNNQLVPRSLMHTQFKAFLAKMPWENHRVLDMCAGTGCIGITLALLNPHIKVDLADISNEALEVARINIKNHHLEDRVRCIQTNMFENIDDKYDLIISSPPYVTEADYLVQPEEVKNEPKIALTAGEDGLDIVHVFLKQSKSYLNTNGRLIIEVGYPAAKLLKKKYPKLPLKWLKCKSTLGYDPMTDWILVLAQLLIRWTSHLDSIFVCEAKYL